MRITDSIRKQNGRQSELVADAKFGVARVQFKCLNCARAPFYAYVLPFNVVTNRLCNLTVIFHTEEGLYTRNVCVNTQF